MAVSPRRKKGDCIGNTRKGKGTKWMVVASGEGVPVGIHLDSASPAEVKLLTKAIDNIRVRGRRPVRIVADLGYDSDPLRRELAARGIDLIAPNRRNHRKTADGRKLRRYRRRWIIERTMAWLGNFRRLVVRYEHRIDIYRGFFHLACLMIALNRF